MPPLDTKETIEFYCNGKNVTCLIKRSKKRSKTVSIRVSGLDQISIYCPIRTHKKYLEEILERKRPWLEKSLEKYNEAFGRSFQKSFKEGETFYYLGSPYKLKIVKILPKSGKSAFHHCFRGQYLSLAMSGDFLKEGSSKKIKELLKNWFKITAQEYLLERVELYSRKYHFNFNQIKISDAKNRWGSCDSKKNLRFNWRLLMASPYLIDYVITHELCHTVHMNHSDKFWNLVGSILPDYQARKNELKKLGIYYQL